MDRRGRALATPGLVRGFTKKLPPDERQALADALWDSVEGEPAA
jgi:hypothetical protein